MSRLDEAARRWGKAEVITGQGQSFPLDLSAWTRQRLTAADEGLSGIAREHFPVFQATAREKACVIIVRRTKPACLPWIKQDYPAKPASVWKVKTNAATGLVTCSRHSLGYGYENQVTQAWEAGYFVLERAGAALERAPLPDQVRPTLRSPDPLGAAGLHVGVDVASGVRVFRRPEAEVLRARRFDELGPGRFEGHPYEPGQVIDPVSGLPLTGDYDLMGVFPMDGAGAKSAVLVHDAAASASQLEMTDRGPLLKMRENPYVMGIAGALNAGFGGRPRVMHGAHDLKFDPTEKNEEGCSLFWPEGAAWIASAEEVQRLYDQLGRSQRLPRV